MSDPLLTPFSIRGITFRNRIMSTSHACGLEEGGMPADRYQAYHEEKARGGIGLTMFGGSSNVAPDSPSVFQQLNVGVDRVIPHLQKLSERVHGHGAKLMCQITHLGRRGEPYAGHWLPTIAPSAMRETLHRSFPKEMDEHDIARVVRAYGDAAFRCKEGGLDGIETLAGGHLIGQFLSPKTNARTDRFGGSLENRCRFGLMVFEEIRRRVGDGFLVGFRFVIDEGDAEGLDFNACVEIAKRFEAEADIDFLNAIFGRMDTEIGLAVDNMPGMASPIAPWLEPVGRFKREIGLPVFHAARITDIATARHAIAEGHLDMVAMTRAQIADPHLVAKLSAGAEARIRPCVGATHCMSPHRPVCLHNAATGRETTFSHAVTPAVAPRRILVVGGGPAGLEAARVAGERGHRVTLFEAAPGLGGQVPLAARASWRGDLIGMIDWRVAELEKLGVEVDLNRYAEMSDVMAHDPDVVIIATGGTPDLDWLPGAEHVTSVWDLLSGGVPLGAEILVHDGTGRHPAPHAAEMAAEAGSAVSLFSIDGHLAAELTYSERVIWKKRTYELGVETRFDHRLVGVEKSGNRLVARLINEVTGAEAARAADQIVVEHGTAPADGLYRDLRASAGNDGVTDLDALLAGAAQPNPGQGFELHRIGDAVASRNIPAAILDAFRLMRVI
jgi:2,4-dienoyl-CoA reductase-like NADH-dependent reductase (Old Yellow Enzyme family)